MLCVCTCNHMQYRHAWSLASCCWNTSHIWLQYHCGAVMIHSCGQLQLNLHMLLRKPWGKRNHTFSTSYFQWHVHGTKSTLVRHVYPSCSRKSSNGSTNQNHMGHNRYIQLHCHHNIITYSATVHSSEIITLASSHMH